MDPFLADVHAGLSSVPKTLSSKYFYDAIGSDLFTQIMATPEYYLTRAEMQIFTEQAIAIVDSFAQTKSRHFDLIELGAGDGSKTVHLLRELLSQQYQFDYLPIDISASALAQLKSRLQQQLPSLSIQCKEGDFFTLLGELKHSANPKIVLFLGSNIGNLNDAEAAHFIESLANTLNDKDKLLLGVDLIKPADIVLPAYDDAAGITKAFNLNLLTRINHELGGNAEISQFEHQAEYKQEEGIAHSFLVSRCDQTLTLKANKQSYSFTKGERIKVEISRKYNQQIVEQIIVNTPFRIINQFSDKANRFTDFMLEVQQ